jgi:hypothetical protein
MHAGERTSQSGLTLDRGANRHFRASDNQFQPPEQNLRSFPASAGDGAARLYFNRFKRIAYFFVRSHASIHLTGCSSGAKMDSRLRADMTASVSTLIECVVKYCS